MNFSGQCYPDNTVGYFRISTSTGRNPIEPVCVGEFRIGRGADCHLRFDDPALTEIHAVLQVDPGQVKLKTASATPPILVNGTPQTECCLQDGDLVELGDHRLLFRLAEAENRITLDESTFVDSADGGDTPEALARVVEQLEEQIHLVEDLAHTPEKGLVELIQAVADRGAGPAESTAVDTTPASNELQQVKALIQKHHDASQIRLESLTSVLDNVVRQQKLIADTLEVMSERIQAINTDGFNQRRASA